MKPTNKVQCGQTIMQGLKLELGAMYRPNQQEKLIIDSITRTFEEVEHLVELLSLPLKTVIESCLSYTSLAEILRSVVSLNANQKKDQKEMKQLRKDVLQYLFEVQFSLVEHLVGRSKTRGISEASIHETVMISLTADGHSNIHLKLLGEVGS